ncbi:MAG: iron complex transport system substrate-binding protein [Limisphaerales bacterium]|jgi:iron complex transport system substrate-binding protein
MVRASHHSLHLCIFASLQESSPTIGGASRVYLRCVYYLQVNRTIAVPLFLLVLIAISGNATALPQRIVSINQCADELLLNLADIDQIRSVTHYVKDPQASWDASLAVNIPGNYGRIEEVIGYDPDLVFVGDFNARSTVNILRNLGVEVVELRHPRRLEQAIAQILEVAAKVGHPERGKRLIAELREQLEPGDQPVGKVSAVVYQPNGFTTGKETIIDDVMQAAGLNNIASEWDTTAYSYFPMERLLWRRPQLLILDPQSHDAPSMAHQMLEHPALIDFFGQTRTVSVPPQAWACGSHHVGRAVTLLRQAAAPFSEAAAPYNEAAAPYNEAAALLR